MNPAAGIQSSLRLEHSITAFTIANTEVFFKSGSQSTGIRGLGGQRPLNRGLI